MDAQALGWLGQKAGFQISESLLSASPDDSYAYLLLAGAVNTLGVAAIAIPLATALGLALGLLRLTRHPLLERVLALLVEPIRNTPVLLQLFFWYALLLALPPIRQAWQPFTGVMLSNRGLSLPALDGIHTTPVLLALGLLAAHHWLCRRLGISLGLLAASAAVLAALGQDWSQLQWSRPALAGLGVRGGWTLSPELTTLLLGLTVFHAAYISDVVRGAILAVPAGQIHAGMALGMPLPTLARHVVYPYAARVAIPPYANQCLMLLKNSTLAIAIGFQELMAIVNTTITQTGRAIEGMTLAMAFYLVVGMAVAALVSAYNRHVTRTLLTSTAAPRLGQILQRPGWSAAALLQGGQRTALTLVLGTSLLWLLWHAIDWAFLGAVWAGDAQACQGARGACWAVITTNMPLLFFGTIAAAQRSQAALSCALLVVVVLLVLCPWLRFWQRVTATIGLGAVVLAILQGLIGPWPPLPTIAWGGVLSTLTLAVTAILAALPIAIVLALMRMHPFLPLRALSATIIDAIRSIPLVVLLLVCSFWIPLLVRGDWSSAKFILALLALVLHTSCMLAEVLRGALQAVPPGQTMAAKALGMRPGTILATIVLPQARRLAAPAALGVFVGAIKDTSLVAIIGVFDTLAAAKAVIADTGWRPYFTEVYLFVALFYLLLCIPLSILSRRLSRQ